MEWQTYRGKPPWMHANGMSALPRLVAIYYPKWLKYYVGWLTLTVWPLSGDCVGKCVWLQACSKFHFCGQSGYGFLEVRFGRPSTKEELNYGQGVKAVALLPEQLHCLATLEVNTGYSYIAFTRQRDKLIIIQADCFERYSKCFHYYENELSPELYA